MIVMLGNNNYYYVFNPFFIRLILFIIQTKLSTKQVAEAVATETTTTAGIKSFSMNNNNYKMLLKGIHLQMVSSFTILFRI